MKTTDVWVGSTALGEALHLLRMTGSLYCASELTAPWGIELPAIDDAVMFHFVTSGECWLEVDGLDSLLLQPGDLALVPHGGGHRLVWAPGAPSAPLFDLPRELLSERYEVLRHGGGGARTGVMCGVASFDHPLARQFLRLLPAAMIVRAARDGDSELIHTLLRLMASEASGLRPGGETVVTRLADILVIQAIRSWIEQEPAARNGWLGALQDEHIGPALALIHRTPDRDWTVDALAREAAMSRSAFAARFAELVGEPPMRYLARWRMSVAHERLRTEDVRIVDLAAELGYQSEAAFSRTFKRFMGRPPRDVKRRNTAIPPSVTSPQLAIS